MTDEAATYGDGPKFPPENSALHDSVFTFEVTGGGGSDFRLEVVNYTDEEFAQLLKLVEKAFAPPAINYTFPPPGNLANS